MAERLDPFQNIVGVGWREDSTEGTEEPLPKPEYRCEFWCGSNKVDRTTNRGLSREWYTGDIGGYYEYPTDSPVQGKMWHLTKEIVLVQAHESVTERGIYQSISPASSWQFMFALEDPDSPLGYTGAPWLPNLLRGKYLIWNGFYSPLVPQFYTEEDATGPEGFERRIYPFFGPQGLPNNLGPAMYGPLGTTTLYTPTYYSAAGDRDPPGGQFVLGLEPGTKHTMWIVDSLDEVTE
jgi:hypothetical protein